MLFVAIKEVTLEGSSLLSQERAASRAAWSSRYSLLVKQVASFTRSGYGYRHLTQDTAYPENCMCKAPLQNWLRIGAVGSGKTQSTIRRTTGTCVCTGGDITHGICINNVLGVKV